MIPPFSPEYTLPPGCPAPRGTCMVSSKPPQSAAAPPLPPPAATAPDILLPRRATRGFGQLRPDSSGSGCDARPGGDVEAGLPSRESSP